MKAPPTGRPGVPTQTSAPLCPNCHRGDRLEIEDQSGSSARWYVCEACGTRFVVPFKRA